MSGLLTRQYAGGKWSASPLPSELPLPPKHWLSEQQQHQPPPPPSSEGISSSSKDVQQQQPAGAIDSIKKLKAALKIDD